MTEHTNSYDGKKEKEDKIKKALKYGIEHNLTSLVEWSLEKMTNDNFEIKVEDCLLNAVEKKVDIVIVEKLIEYLSKRNSKLKILDIDLDMSIYTQKVGKNSYLMYLIHADPRAALKRLTSEDITEEELNYQNDAGWTILHYLCRNNTSYSCEMIQTLMNNPKVDVNLQTKKSCTALIMAFEYCQGKPIEKIVEMLLKNSKVDVNLADGQGYTPLMLSAKTTPKIFGLLLSHPDVDVNSKNESGYTALMMVNCEIKLEKLLSHPKVDVNLKDRVGSTAFKHHAKNLSWIAQNSTLECKMKMLKIFLNDARVDINDINDKQDGDSLLAYLLRCRREISSQDEIMKCFLKREDLRLDPQLDIPNILRYLEQELVNKYFTIKIKINEN